MPGESFAKEVATHLPRLLAYAMKIARSRSAADDLVQETMLRALLHADQFQLDSNLGAWLTVILRNCYLNDLRIQRRLRCFDPQNDGLTIDQPQQSYVWLREVQRQIANLPKSQREAILLVALNGDSYKQAAMDAGCAVGTIKSRVSRGRSELVQQYFSATPEGPASSALGFTRKWDGRAVPHAKRTVAD